jgi:hypothetical protein
MLYAPCSMLYAPCAHVHVHVHHARVQHVHAHVHAHVHVHVSTGQESMALFVIYRASRWSRAGVARGPCVF